MEYFVVKIHYEETVSSVGGIISEQIDSSCPRPRRDKIRPWREKKKRKTSQSTLLHGGDVGMCGGSWGYVRETENNFFSEVTRELQSCLENLVIV